MTEDSSPFLPLSPATLHILLSLAGEDRHGYGIMQEVARQSEGQYKLGPGTLYDNLQKMTDLGLVEERKGGGAHLPATGEPSRRTRLARSHSEAQRRSGEDDPRRKYYRLTSLGRRVLSAEIARLENVVREAKAHLRRPATGRVS